MVENTERTRQLKTKTNLNKNTKLESNRMTSMGWPHPPHWPNPHFHWSQTGCALKWNCSSVTNSWTHSGSEGRAAHQRPGSAIAQLFPVCSEQWTQPLFNFLRYQVNHACLCNMVCKKQAVKLRLLENKQHPTTSTLPTVAPSARKP